MTDKAGTTSGFAIASLIMAFILGPIGWILGIVFGHIALTHIKYRGQRGKGLAIAGLVISYLALTGFVVALTMYS